MKNNAHFNKASVVIPAYNAEQFISEAIDSVISQSYPNVECIVVDDGSTDGTVAVVKEYGEKVKLVCQENSERSAARNAGVRESCGEYISFLDADDYISPEKIALQLEYLATHPEYEVVYSDSCYFVDNGSRNFNHPTRRTPVGDVVPELIYQNSITVNSPLMTRQAFDRCSGFDPELTHYEDWDFLLRLALSGARFGHVDAYHAFCRLHPSNTIRDHLRMFEGKLTVAKKIVSVFAEELLERGLKTDEIVAFHKADYGRALIIDNQLDAGCRLIREAAEAQFPYRKVFLIYAMLADNFGKWPIFFGETLLSWYKLRKR